MGIAIKCDRCGTYESPLQPTPIRAQNWMAPGWMGLQSHYDVNTDSSELNVTLCTQCKLDFNAFMQAKKPMTKAAS